MTNKKLAKENMTQWLRKTSRLLLAPCAIALAASCLQSCEKDVLTGQPVWLGNSIYERLEQGIVVDGNRQTFKTTLRLIDDLDQTTVLSKTGSRTVFAASDEAYERFFEKNDWGVHRYEDLSMAQKKILFNNSVISNAYLLELMSNVSGNPPQQGLCMRRETSLSIFDSIPTMEVEEMPVDPMLKARYDTWTNYREKGQPIHILKNDQSAPMIHFLPEFMIKNNITDKDLEILTNGKSKSIADSWINGKKVISSEQTCKNGYIYVVEDVIESNKNMAEIINTNEKMTIWSRLLNRFATPAKPSRTLLADYQRLYNTEDSVFVLRYFSKESQGKATLDKTPVGDYKVPATLAFDPGLNQYMWKNNMGYDMHYDAGAMIVPTDSALNVWWNNAGRGLQEEYGSWENIDTKTLSKLINVNMLPSFVDAVPSKFGSIVDDSKVELGIKPEDIESCFMGCNGVVYLVRTVFPPSEYKSVVYPALSHRSKMSVIYDAIENYDFGPYLNSMESKFSLFLPYNTGLGADASHEVFRYIDPCFYGMPQQVMYEFYYDEEDQKIKADRYGVSLNSDGSYNYETILSPATDALIKNRLKDLVDNLIVVGMFNDPSRKYFKTKAGSMIRVENDGNTFTVQGGLQLETGNKITITGDDIYDMTKGVDGNGQSYGINEDNEVPMTASKTVYEILKEEADNGSAKVSLFYKLLADDPSKDALLSSTTGSSSSTYYCVNDQNNKNLKLFDNYNYTVYVPTDDAIQEMIDNGYLPTWDDYAVYDIDAEREDKYAMACQDTIANIIRNFIRYHVQDNSVIIGGERKSGELYETSKLNPENKRFYPLGITSDDTSIKVVDYLGQEHNVVKNQNFYNKICREYWIKGKYATYNTVREIYSSSNAVVHQIDGVLLYSESQKKNWKTYLPTKE